MEQSACRQLALAMSAERPPPAWNAVRTAREPLRRQKQKTDITKKKQAKRESRLTQLWKDFPWVHDPWICPQGLDIRVQCRLCRDQWLPMRRRVLEQHQRSEGHLANVSRQACVENTESEGSEECVESEACAESMESEGSEECVDSEAKACVDSEPLAKSRARLFFQRTLAAGLTPRQIQRLWADRSFLAVAACMPVMSQQWVRRQVQDVHDALRARLKAFLRSLGPLPYSIVLAESSSTPLLGVVLTSMYGTWLLRSVQPSGPTYDEKKAQVQAVVEEYGLESADCVSLAPAELAGGAGASSHIHYSPHAVQLVFSGFVEPLARGMRLVYLVASLFTSSSVKARAREAGLDVGRLWLSSSWNSHVETARCLGPQLDAVGDFLAEDIPKGDFGDVLAGPAEGILEATSLLSESGVDIEVYILGTLGRLGGCLTAVQARERNKLGPRHMRALTRAKADWQQAAAGGAVDLVKAGVSVAVWEGLEEREKAGAVSLYRQCSREGLAAYEEVLAETLRLVPLINVYHPCYLAVLSLDVDDEAALDLLLDRATYPVLYRGLDQWDVLREEFFSYVRDFVGQRNTRQPTGAAYWSREPHQYPNLAVVARRVLSVRLSVPPLFAPRQADGSLGSGAETEHVAAEAFLRVNDAEATWAAAVDRIRNEYVFVR